MLIAILVVLAVIFVFLILNREMNGTKELERLNNLWDEFNEMMLGKGTDEDLDSLENRIFESRWEYHSDKVMLLLEFIRLEKRLRNIRVKISFEREEVAKKVASKVAKGIKKTKK